MRRRFTCELCQGTFETDVPVSEVAAEAEGIFGPLPADRSLVVSVCDPCYELVMAWAERTGQPKRWGPVADLRP
jgi:hypothetical protein